MLDKLICGLGFEPTKGQTELFNELAAFVTNFTDNRIFLISGFAGTGKTSAISSLVSVLNEMKQKTVLLAPTGRAAKVLSAYSKSPAFTIHKKIYRQKSQDDGIGRFGIDRNLHTDTLFIVDEASMVGNASMEQAVFGTGRLLDDLVHYVQSGTRCRLILIGDRAQLPPVGFSVSPALDSGVLSGYGDCLRVELNDVVRQAANSGILLNANMLRKNIDEKCAQLPSFTFNGFNDIERISSVDVQELITSTYDKYGQENAIVVCYSNKRANRYNLGIRAYTFGRDEELVPGDRLMVVKNCYQLLEKNETFDFVANGDVTEVVRIRKYEERYGLRFANVLLRFPDYNDLEVESKILLDTLSSESPSLGAEKGRELFMSIAEDYAHIGDKRKRYKAIKEDPYYNALQVKYAYAVTCHKAQGGQWKTVFLDQLFFKDGEVQIEDLRWLYTAFTRATEKLYLVNFKEK